MLETSRDVNQLFSVREFEVRGMKSVKHGINM